jgi:subtilisin-like proprotein convertase family protein
MNSGDLIRGLSGLCVSGKRLNAYNSLPPLWLSADPTSQTITQGETSTYNINIESVIGFSESVTLNTSNPTINANITFQPNPGNPGSSSSMDVITTTATDSGDYIITVTGDSDSINKTTTVMLTVKPEGLTTVSYPNDPNPDISMPDCVYPCESSTSHGIIMSTIYVPDSLNVWEIASEVNITHPYRGDMGVKLTSPIGTEAILKLPDRTDWADNIHQTYYPTEFMNENCQGCWKLIVSDEMWDDVGTLNNWTLAIDGISTDPFNKAPTVTITAPADGSTFTEGEGITFTGTANDFEEGDILASLLWNSSIDGDFDDPGASVTIPLSAGTHIITARVIDSVNRTGCDSITVDVLPVCNNNGICEAGEDCNNCPSDCISGGGEFCGNGICEPLSGEDCGSCPNDCAGKQGGKPSKRFCCGDGAGENPVNCGDPRCSSEDYSCSDTPTGPFCCGDGFCRETEDSYNCEIDCGLPPFCGDVTCGPGEDKCSCPDDCGTPPSMETDCSDGFDNDCDGFADCIDSDCTSESACQCLPRGELCTENSECCSYRCFREKCK